MSSAAPAPQRLTNGYAAIPNSLIENQSFLTHAELSMALIVLRRGGGTDDGIPVSDANWEKWTGLGARQKKYAIAGLQKKGLRVDGRGDQARYRWQRDMWDSYARQREREERAKTEGRKPAAVPAKKGAMVHPACREGGCSMMKNPPAGELIQMPGPIVPIEMAWPETLAGIREVFPLVSGAFVARLVSVVKTSIGSVTDAELAKGVAIAYKRNQQGEGLFLHTVPEALAAIRRVRPKPVPAAAGGIEKNAIAEQIEKVIAVLYGDTWAPRELLEDLQRLLTRVERTELQQLDDEMIVLEKRIIEAAHVSITDPQRVKIRDRVASQMKPYALKMSPAQLDQLSRQLLEREILQYFDVPRLGVFYS